MLVLQLRTRRVDWKFPLIRKKSLCGFSALSVGQQNLEGGNSRLILFRGSGALPASTPSSSVKKDDGVRIQLASQIKQNIWRLRQRPKPKNEFDLKEIVRPIFRFHLFTCNHSAVLWRKIFPADANTVQTYGDHVLKHLSFSTWSRRHRFVSLEEETSLTRFGQISTVASLNRQHIHASISEFGKTVYMQLEPDIFVVE